MSPEVDDTMFQEKSAMFIYCVSPVHMGAGTAIGTIDNPIQRERHTGHPMMCGSGLKGALRHHVVAQVQPWDEPLVADVFGPDVAASEFAGAVSFADAQLVLFPVRSLRNTYVYATCPTALERLRRSLCLAGLASADGPAAWTIPAVDRDGAVVLEDKLLVEGYVVLEAFRFKQSPKSREALSPIAAWLADNALPAGDAFEYFRDKVQSDLVLLSDDRFNYFVKNATIVEPHVRIDDESGTASDGGLFYTENLPPESLLVSTVMASRGRREGAKALPAREVLDHVRGGGGKPGLDNTLVQIGGDATTGRGQVVLRFAAKGGSNG